MQDSQRSLLTQQEPPQSRRMALLAALLLGAGLSANALVRLNGEASTAPRLAPLKIYAAGSGEDMFALTETVDEVISLAGKARPAVLYLGTATYDAPAARQKQTSGFEARGCRVSALRVAWDTPGEAEMRNAMMGADVILISGGNTLFAIDRWRRLGVDALLRRAAARGAVLAGGSAGFISLCEGGHSDSMEPASYKNPPGPQLALMNASWAYIRVPGVGLLKGLCCPHYDVTGSNGVERADDFTAMLRHHSGEDGIGVDNWAAIAVDGDHYRVVSRRGKPGSVARDGGGFVAKGAGSPGVWKLRIGAMGSLERARAVHAPRRHCPARSEPRPARRRSPLGRGSWTSCWAVRGTWPRTRCWRSRGRRTRTTGGRLCGTGQGGE